MKRALLLLLLAGCMEAEAGPAKGPGHGPKMLPRLNGPSSPLVDPSACTVISIAGQSLGTGTCGGGTCVAQSTSASTTDYVLNATDAALCAIREGTGCGFADLESPATAMVNTWRALRGGTSPAIIAARSAVGSTTLANWADGGATTHTEAWTNDITDIETYVAASPATYGCDHINVRAVFWIHGESNFSTTTYNTDLETVMTTACADIQAVTGQTNCPEWFLSPPSTWNVANSFTSPINPLEQMDVADGLARVHIIDAKYVEPYETVSPWLHLQATGSRHVGAQAGKAMYRVLEGGDTEYGLWPTTASASGTTIQVCMDAPVPPLVLDTTTCPAHPNGDYGLEYYQAELGAPAITGVAVNGTNTNCLDLTMASAPIAYSGRRLRAAYTGTGSLGSHNGCQTSGFPYTNIRDSDTTTIFGGGNAYNWALPFDVPITGGAAFPTSQATGYFRFNANTEHLNLADNAALEVGTAATWAFRIREGSLTNSVRVAWKSASWDLLTYHVASTNGLRMYLNNPAWNARFLGTEFDTTGNWISFVMVYDGSQATEALRLRAWINCREIAQTGATGTSPTSLADNANALQVNASAAGHPSMDMAIFAMWAGTAATSAQVAELCASTANYSTLTIGQPTVEARPDANDDNVTVTNYGSYATDWTPTNMESDDVVQGGGP